MSDWKYSCYSWVNYVLVVPFKRGLKGACFFFSKLINTVSKSKISKTHANHAQNWFTQLKYVRLIHKTLKVKHWWADSSADPFLNLEAFEPTMLAWTLKQDVPFHCTPQLQKHNQQRWCFWWSYFWQTKN